MLCRAEFNSANSASRTNAVPSSSDTAASIAATRGRCTRMDSGRPVRH